MFSIKGLEKGNGKHPKAQPRQPLIKGRAPKVGALNPKAAKSVKQLLVVFILLYVGGFACGGCAMIVLYGLVTLMLR